MELIKALELVKVLPEGDYAEVGVYKGDSAEKICLHKSAWLHLYLFDTFSGHPHNCEFDDSKEHPVGRYSDVDYQQVRNRLSFASNVHFVRGDVCQTLAAVEHRRFRFVNLDCDLYAPYKTCMEFFLPRMVAGGLIRFDDYDIGGCEGATKALNDFIGAERIVDRCLRVT